MDIYHMSKGVARRFIKYYDINTPLNIKEALEHIKVKIIYTSLNKIGAFSLLNEKNERLIVVNFNYGNEEQRFFIAHEIGHILLNHEGFYFYSLQYRYKNILEDKLADAFARELLMPRDILRELAYFYSYDVNFLKNYFNVPELEMVIRLRNIGLPYCNSSFRF